MDDDEIIDYGCHVKDGDYVYLAYHAQKPGKVMAIDRVVYRKFTDYFVTVKWVDGTESKHKDYLLRSFSGLIKDHEKKLATHTSKLPLLEKL